MQEQIVAEKLGKVRLDESMAPLCRAKTVAAVNLQESSTKVPPKDRCEADLEKMEKLC